ARHVDHVVGALGMTDENERAELAGLVRLYDARNRRFPGQVAHGLGFDSLAPQVGGEAVKPGREHAKPSAQQINASLGFGSAAREKRQRECKCAAHRAYVETPSIGRPHGSAPVRSCLRSESESRRRRDRVPLWPKPPCKTVARLPHAPPLSS